jgi:hypothetical protein
LIGPVALIQDLRNIGKISERNTIPSPIVASVHSIISPLDNSKSVTTAYQQMCSLFFDDNHVHLIAPSRLSWCNSHQPAMLARSFVDCAGQAGTRLGFGSDFGSVCLGTRHPTFGSHLQKLNLQQNLSRCPRRRVKPQSHGPLATNVFRRVVAAMEHPASYFFFVGVGTAGRSCRAVKADCATAAFGFSCFGFFCSRLLRF